MLTIKKKKLLGAMLLAIMGMGYFTTMSSLDINFFLKGYVAIMPMQALALIYVGYLRWFSR